VRAISEPSIPLAAPPPAAANVAAGAGSGGVALGAVLAADPAAPAAPQATGGRVTLGAGPGGDSLLSDSVVSPPGTPERGLSAFAARPTAEFAPVRTIQATAQDLRGIALVMFEQAEPLANRFSITVRSENAAVEELQRTLRSTAFADQLNRLREGVQDDLQLDRSVTISVAGVSLGLSLVYVLWLIRGGVLMVSYLWALPAWGVLDPLPVLSRVDEDAEEDDEALDAVPERGGNPLRGF
jgi:hypothetical protein